MRFVIDIAKSVVCTLSLAVVLLAPTAVLAQAPDGAQVVKDSNCTEDGDGYTQCYELMTVYNETATPSGNFTYAYHASYEYIECDPSGAVSYRESGDAHNHLLTQDGFLQELDAFYTHSYPDFDTGETCTHSFAFHLANGKLQFTRTTTCE